MGNKFRIWIDQELEFNSYVSISDNTYEDGELLDKGFE